MIGRLLFSFGPVSFFLIGIVIGVVMNPGPDDSFKPVNDDLEHLYSGHDERDSKTLTEFKTIKEARERDEQIKDEQLENEIRQLQQ